MAKRTTAKPRKSQAASNTRKQQQPEAVASPAAETKPAAQPAQRAPEKTTPASSNRCRACDSTDLVVLRKLGEQSHAGYAPDGKRYTSIIRRRVQCRHCQQAQVTIERVFDPTKWKSSANK